jgi:hypothetical protein
VVENTTRWKWNSPQFCCAIGRSTSNRRNKFVCYESRKRDLKTRPTYECRCDERLKTKSAKSTRPGYTWLLGELEHLKIKTRLINEMFASVMGEYVFLK